MQILAFLFTLFQLTFNQPSSDTSKSFLIFIIGKIHQNHIAETTLEQFETIDYKNPADIIILKNNIFTNELGENGKQVNLNFNFIDMRSSQFFLNGRTLNAHIYPYPSLNMLPMDNIFLIETDNSFSSPLFSNANSSITNFIFKNLYTPRPITRIRYIEDAYDLTIADGSFSYNILKNSNLTLGFRRSSSAGRFLNSQYDTWNLFANSFWAIKGNVILSLLDIYTIENNALNGGIDMTNLSIKDESVIYNERIAPVIEQNAKLALKRNDFTLSSNYHIDSLNLINLTLYHTFQKDKFTSLKDPNEKSSNFYGLKFNLSSSTRFANLNACLEVQKSNLTISLLNDTLSTGYLKRGSNSLTLLSSFLEAKINFNKLIPLAFLRVENLNKKMFANYGLGISLNHDHFEIRAGLSHSFRILTLLEQIISNSSEPEKHIVYEVGGGYKSKNLSIEAKIQNRKITNYLVFSDSSFHRAYLSRIFVEADFHLKIWKLAFKVSPYIILNKVTRPYPRYFLRGEFFFEGKLTKTLNLRAGVRFVLSDKFYGFRFINSAFLFTESEIELKKFNTFDLFISGRIKSVVVFLSLVNVMDAKYMTSSFYPMQNRSLRFGIVWTFFD